VLGNQKEADLSYVEMREEIGFDIVERGDCGSRGVIGTNRAF